MKVLLVHNYYQLPGGEDIVFKAEKALLTNKGHQVTEYVRHSDEILDYNSTEKAKLALRSIWSQNTYKQMSKLLCEDKPDIVHFHNIFPLISPAAYHACRIAGVPIVQSLHNPRFLCPAAIFYRDGRVCEDCLGKAVVWHGMAHACYRGSFMQTCVFATTLAIHKWLRTWERLVDVFIVFTDFYRRKFIEGGFPALKMVIKPHFVAPDPGRKEGRGDFALFVGRLTQEKGVRTLLAAWARLNNIPLKIAGDGPLTKEVENFARNRPHIDVLKHLPHDAVFALMKKSRFLVWPSECYETFGLVAAEAFACGLPVIASKLGAIEEIVTDGRNGLHCLPNNPEDLAARAQWAWNHPERTEVMGREARLTYEAEYTEERNYSMLMSIYSQAILSREGM